jgi:hypothetical protein
MFTLGTSSMESINIMVRAAMAPSEAQLAS